MLKVLIADDEPGHRMGLIRHVHWTELGYEMPLQAEDAEEALFLTQGRRIDVLIADVCMPGMDGIELVKEMRGRYPDIRVLIISGYEEFEFARSAVEAGAKAYLLKPLKIEEVERWLKKFHDEIRMEAQLLEADLVMKKKLLNSLEIARERFFEELLEDTLDEAVLTHRAELLELPAEEFCCRVALLSIDDYNILLKKEPEAGSTLIYRIMNMIRTAFGDCPVLAVKFGLNRVVVLLPVPSGKAEGIGDELEDRFHIIKKSVEENQHATVTVSISSEGYGWKQVYRLYAECVRLLSEGLLYEKGQIIRSERMQRYRPDFGDDIAQLSTKMTESIKAMDIEKITQLIEEAFLLFSVENRFTLSFVQSFSLGVISELARKTELAGLQLGRHYTGYCEQIIGCVSLDEIREATLGIVSAYFNSLEEYQNQRKSKVVESALRYLSEHLEEDTTVKELSEIVHMNASYLSVLFKKETGETITDYVNRLRIEKAKSLLQQGYKVFDIAQRVGYRNPSYFANQFRKSVGCTPAEYKKYTP